jgi:putative Mg2+ transporter-C (MgtC) family protein
LIFLRDAGGRAEMDTVTGLAPDFGKLLVAAFISGLIGFEREAHGQAAGFRTYLIVGIGSCLMMLLSLRMEELYHQFNVNQSVVRIDPGRIASYAIASMGFLGAGAIIKGRGSVRGLTTAAGLWVVTGMGLSIGAGYIFQTLFATCLILIALYWLHPIREIAGRRIYSRLCITLKGETDPLDEIRKIISGFPLFTIQNIDYSHQLSSQMITYCIRVYSKEKEQWKDLVRALSSLQGVIEIRWEESDVP